MNGLNLNFIQDTLSQLQGQVRQGLPLRIRGAGTKDFYGAFDADTQVLDTRPLAGILRYEPTELVVTALAGTALVELESLLEEQNQYLPFEPPRFVGGGLERDNESSMAGGTVGGMVAAGLSGPARASVGALREYVLGVQMINGCGELLRYGGEVIKNVAGYDVSRLMAGSLGNLGLITAVSLKVLGKPAAEATLKMELTQQAALNALNAWGVEPLPLNASAWIASEESAGLPIDSGKLYLRLRGAWAAVASAIAALGQSHGAEVAGCFDWNALRDQTHSFFQEQKIQAIEKPQQLTKALWRLSLPQTAPALTLPSDCGATLVEWHGGLRWVWASLNEATVLRQLALAHGGHATLYRLPESVDAQAIRVARFADLEPALHTLNQRVRAAFDPVGVFQSRGR